MRSAAVVVLAFTACRTPSSSPLASLSVRALNVPVVSGCLERANLPFVLELSEGLSGQQARLLNDAGDVLADGAIVGDSLELVVPWTVALGPVRGWIEVGQASVAVVFPTEVVAPEAPRILTFGLEQAGVLVDPDTLPDAMALSAWGDAVDVSTYAQVVAEFEHPHQSLGVARHLVFEACVDGACTELPSTPGDPLTASLSPVAVNTCAALPERVTTDVRFQVETACGTATASLSVRLVHEDCDGDGVGVLSDCDDQAGVVSVPGTVVADGVPVGSLAESVGAQEVLLCVDDQSEPFPANITWSQQVVVRGVGGVAVLDGQGPGPAVTVLGEVTISAVRIQGGQPALSSAGLLGGNALFAEQAVSLVLRDVELVGGSAESGGALVGPMSGQLLVVGGRWSEGEVSGEGGAALLHGGELLGLEVVHNLAALGGGIANLGGDLLITDSALVGNTASRGGALYTDSFARVSGCTIAMNTAVDGAGIAADLALGEVLDLRPSVVDLSLTRFESNVATGRGGGLEVIGGRVLAVLIEGVGNRADRGGLGFLEGTDWIASATLATGNVADRGGVLALQGGSSEVVQAVWSENSAVEGGGVWLTGGAALSLQASTLDESVGCGVWIDEGDLAVASTTGNNDSDLCGAVFTTDFGPASCSELGCL